MLLLDGYGISIKIDNSKIHIKNGTDKAGKNNEEYIFSPKRIDVNHIVIYGRSGNISIDAIRWLIKHNVQISILNWEGKLLTTMLPPESVQVKTKFAQYQAFSDPQKRMDLARKFLEAKFERTKETLDWLKLRYPELRTDFSKELPYFRKAKTIKNLMITEGRIASFYWQELRKIVPKKYEFTTREFQKRPWGAGDTVNCLLNYGYAILEAECLKAINTAGLDTHIGFLHEANLGKNSLAYDLQEPFRFLIDLVVISLIENDIMEKKDFIRTENYNLRLRSTGAKKVLTEIEKMFNQKAEFNNQQWAWRYVIQEQTTNLAQLLVGKKKEITFLSGIKGLKRQDSDDIRKKIMGISYTDWKNLGFSKGTLHYMKKNAASDKPFTMNKQVRDRLAEWNKMKVGIKD
ncbi:MAG: CRISPR-associated endonuclease Cas1 [Candidatus Woesearchaeota archaeon]|jgi:CRISPR-associated protein Cas1